MLSANYCPFVDSAFGKNSFYFSFRWKKDARNFQSMCFENLPPLEELFGELIDNILKIYQRFLTKMWKLLLKFYERYAHQKNLHDFKLTKKDLFYYIII